MWKELLTTFNGSFIDSGTTSALRASCPPNYPFQSHKHCDEYWAFSQKSCIILLELLPTHFLLIIIPAFRKLCKTLLSVGFSWMWILRGEEVPLDNLLLCTTTGYIISIIPKWAWLDLKERRVDDEHVL